MACDKNPGVVPSTCAKSEALEREPSLDSSRRARVAMSDLRVISNRILNDYTFRRQPRPPQSISVLRP